MGRPGSVIPLTVVQAVLRNGSSVGDSPSGRAYACALLQHGVRRAAGKVPPATHRACVPARVPCPAAPAHVVPKAARVCVGRGVALRPVAFMLHAGPRPRSRWAFSSRTVPRSFRLRSCPARGKPRRSPRPRCGGAGGPPTPHPCKAPPKATAKAKTTPTAVNRRN
jgi:hypothetical protein